MANIATAYVQIVPSARGLSGNLERELDGTGAGETAGKQAGTSFLSKFKSLIVAAGVGKLVTEGLKKSLSEGAALEQSLGGVETLFKDSAETVIENAKRAYETAGMSANTYMEQVTSFSASLLQSLGGDTAAAASVADMAIQDMSDNANKFGTDIDSITNAYQGFAKQNYTMLDNLKLGYGGTKSEMQRLLADAQELSGVEYNIDNLSDVYEAIHVIQDELGVTGTTAKEASSTLTGSLNSMKAAFDNVMGNLALGEEMGPSLEALASTVGTFLNGNLIPMIKNIVLALPGALMTLINTVMPGNISAVVSNAVSNFSTYITTKLPSILKDGVRIVAELANGILEGTPAFIDSGGELLNKLVDTLREGGMYLAEAAVELVKKLASGITASAGNIGESAGKLIAKLLSTFSERAPDLLATGISLVGEIIAGLLSALADLVVAAIRLIKAFCDNFDAQDWKTLGVNIMEGIIKGLKSAISRIVEVAKDIAKRLLDEVKNALGIESPSRVFREEVGVMVARGMALGITDGTPLVEKAMADLADLATADMISTLRISTQGRKTGVGEGNARYNGFGVQVVQNIYSQAQTAADLMRESRYQAEMAVLMGV